MALSTLVRTALKQAFGKKVYADELADAVDNASSGGGAGAASNTNITTVGAGTLTAAGMTGGLITRSGPTAAYTDTTATAAQLWAAQAVAVAGETFYLDIKNTVGFNQTLAGGTGVTLSGQTIIPPNSVGRFLVTLTSSTVATMRGVGISGMTAQPLPAATAISTVGAGTLTAAGIVGGLIVRSGSTAAYTDTVDTAANIIAALPNANVGDGFYFSIKNTVGFNETIATAAGVTLAGQVIVPPNSVGTFHVKVTAATTVTITGVSMVPMTTAPLEANTAITTVGAGTLTAAGIVGKLITRSGSTADYTDTTDTAANIIAAMPNANVGDAFEFSIKNTVAFTETLVTAAGVTLAGLTVIPPLSVGRFLVKVDTASTLTITGIDMQPLCNLPYSKFTTTAAASPLVASAGDLTGAAHVVFQVTTNGAFTLTTRTATLMFGDIPNAQIGMSFLLTVVSQGDNTVTVDPGSGVTITGTATVATKTTRTFVATFTSATALTLQSVSKGTIE